MKKIVIIGPESTGKSTLARQLAEHYKTDWVPEFARAYLLEHGTNYNFEDLLVIAKGQVSLEEAFIVRMNEMEHTKLPVLIMDTNMYVMKVWCEFVFDKCHNWILDQVVMRTYDLYLLCNPDLPWVKDELREYPDFNSRDKLYHMYKDIMVSQSVPWVNINGDYKERFQIAVSAINHHLK